MVIDEAKVLDAFNDPFGFDQVSVEEVEQDEPHTPNEDHTSQLLQDHHQDGLENMSLNEHSLREGDENQHVQVEQQSFGNTDIFMDSAVSLDETNEGANTSDVFDSIPESEMSSNDVKLDQAASTEIRSITTKSIVRFLIQSCKTSITMLKPQMRFQGMKIITGQNQSELSRKMDHKMMDHEMIHKMIHLKIFLKNTVKRKRWTCMQVSMHILHLTFLKLHHPYRVHRLIL